jgi:hypothetical protein
VKVWVGYGSEHSMNLVMIGQFKDVTDAAKAKEIIDWLTEQVSADVKAGELQVGASPDRLTSRMIDLFKRVEIYDLGPKEVEQFAYDVRVKLEGDKVVITTDESDVSAFLKVLLHKDARVEVFSAHAYPFKDVD